MPITLLDKLLAFLEEVHYPLAVRSSSLLEDSQYQPFSGVYETFMLANQHADIQVRLEQLLEAIKLRLRLDLQPARQSLCARHAISPGRRKDGGGDAAGGRRAGTAIGSIPIFPAWCDRATSIPSLL